MGCYKKIEVTTTQSRKFAQTHWSSSSTRRDGNFDTLILFERVDASIRQKLRCGHAIQDLQQYWDRGALEGDAVDKELCEVIALEFVSAAAYSAERTVLTSATFSRMLISAPPGLGFPGCVARFCNWTRNLCDMDLPQDSR